MTKPVRLQLSRRKGFNLQAHSRSVNGLEAVVVARGPGRKWGNPYIFGMFRNGVPLMLRRDGFVRWCFFTEAWLASYQPGQSPATTMPKARPDRMEVVTFYAEVAATGETLAANRQIYREGSRPAKLLPLVFARGRTAFVGASGSCG